MEPIHDGVIHSVSDYNGYERRDYQFEGRDVIVVKPREEEPGKPWAWRMEFFEHFPYADLELLKRGWHIVYHRVSHKYGAPEALHMLHSFQQELGKEEGLTALPVLIGLSRGGVYALNYAAIYPEQVALLYLDAPVIDLNSWPGGKGVGIGSTELWEQCLRVYGVSEESAESHFSNLYQENMRVIAEAGIPVMLVAGDADVVVPYEENGQILADYLQHKGHPIEVIIKKGVGHHPHSLEDPTPIIQFIEVHYKG